MDHQTPTYRRCKQDIILLKTPDRPPSLFNTADFFVNTVLPFSMPQWRGSS